MVHGWHETAIRTKFRAVCSLKYHVVWCPKYRRQVLVPPVDARLKTIIATVAAEYGFTVHAMEVMSDHVHLFIAADPARSVAGISAHAAPVDACEPRGADPRSVPSAEARQGVPRHSNAVSSPRGKAGNSRTLATT